jgi:uncharacterized protein YceK
LHNLLTVVAACLALVALSGCGAVGVHTAANPTADDAGSTPVSNAGSSTAQSPPTSATSGPDASGTPDSPGTAQLSWTAPTTNVDGSPLIDLAGYAVVYGRSAAALDQSIVLNDASLTSYTVTGLQSGVWYFSVRALATNGTESIYSDIATTQVD